MMLKNVVDRAVEAGSFKTLTKALAAAGLVETLTGRGRSPYSSPPRDYAFAKPSSGDPVRGQSVKIRTRATPEHGGHAMPTHTDKETMMPMNTHMTKTKTWPELAIGLYDRLTGRGAEISYEFANLEVLVPGSTAPDAERARWTVSGTVTVRTRDQDRH